jgi:hypothetical protein
MRTIIGVSGHKEESPRLQMAVDATLETHLEAVENAVAGFVGNPSETQRQPLMTALEQLDVRLAAGDDYQSRVASSHLYYGYTGGDSGVFGQADAHPMVEDIAGPVLHAQVELVKAAKEIVRDATPHNLEALHAAQTSLEQVRQSGKA